MGDEIHRVPDAVQPAPTVGPDADDERFAAEMRPGGRPSSWWLAMLPGSALWVMTAVALEVVGGANANSTVRGWAHLVPLGWPQWLRVAWWLGVGSAAATFRVGLRRVGMPTRRLVDAATIAPFLAFAVGIALGADWATWH